MIDATKIYQNLVKSMNEIAEIGSNVIDTATDLNQYLKENAIRLFETIEYEEKSSLLNSAKNKAEKYIITLVNTLNSNLHYFYIDAVNSATNNLNAETKKIEEIKNFIDSDFLTKLLKDYERFVVKESIKEYELKLETIYKILFNYKKNPENQKIKKVTLQNGQIVNHNIEELILPYRLNN